MLQNEDLVRDFAQRRAEHAEHAGVFRKTVARRLPRDVGDAKPQAPHDAAIELVGLGTIGSLGADSPDEAAHEQARLQLAHALVMAAHLGEPYGALVAECDRQRLYAVCAANHRGCTMLFGQAIERLADCLHVAQEDGVRVPQLQHRARVQHILRRRAKVNVFPERRAAFRLQRPQRRNQRMLYSPDLGADRFHVHIIGAGLRRDLVASGARNDPETRLLQCERRLEVVPLLDAVSVIENGAQLIGCPDVF